MPVVVLLLPHVVALIPTRVAPPGLTLRTTRPYWRSPPVCAQVDDPYGVLGVPRDATAAQIKQAYRKLALRNHPDVNKAPDAQQVFTRIAEAYSVLSDAEKRRQFDARGSPFGGASQPRGQSSSRPGRRGPSGYSSSPPNPAAAAAAAERQRRWREENPSPDELGDSFGSLFSDVVSAVGKVVGGGDWIDLLGELQWEDGRQLRELLRSSDRLVLEDELENTRFVQTTLKGALRSRRACHGLAPSLPCPVATHCPHLTRRSADRSAQI